METEINNYPYQNYRQNSPNITLQRQNSLECDRVINKKWLIKR